MLRDLSALLSTSLLRVREREMNINVKKSLKITFVVQILSLSQQLRFQLECTASKVAL